MNRFLVVLLLTAMTALGSQNSPASVYTDQTPPVTFNKDVLPILQRNCQACHRPGEVAPMSFLTYESTRPYAKAIKFAVLSEKMPPWFADPHDGEFRNAPKLTQMDIQTLAAWADTGAREGDAADKPEPIQWKDGWRIQPDIVVSMAQPYRIAANGAGEIKEFFVPNPFKEDTWVSSIEIRPGDPSVVHHVIVQIPENSTKAPTVREAELAAAKAAANAARSRAATDSNRGAAELAAAQQAIKVAAEAQEAALKKSVTVDGFRINQGPGGSGSYNDNFVRNRERETGLGAFMTMEAVYAPGASPLDFRFTDSAKLVKAEKPIRIEVHYTPNGKETMDQTRIGFTLAKGPAQRRFVIMAPEHLVDTRKPIPAGDSNWETTGELTFNQDAELVWFMPHMHLRGKDMTYQLFYPDGRQETVLNVKYNFYWQLGYEVKEPIKMPKGTRMVVTAHHDNSANNRLNPDPDKAVAWGEMTSQEMMLPWFGVVVDRSTQPDAIASYKPGDLDASPGDIRGVRQGIVSPK
jgi:hypothetical protein